MNLEGVKGASGRLDEEACTRESDGLKKLARRFLGDGAFNLFVLPSW
jgi:hypothetical protein